MIVIDASIVLHILADTKVDASVLQKVRSSGDLEQIPFTLHSHNV